MSSGFTVAAVSEVVEEVVADGIVVQTLKSGTADDPSVIRLYRMAPGAVAGEDRHYAWEYLFILEGTFHDGSASWPAGTVISGAPGSVHYPSSVEGAKFLAVHPNGLGEPAAAPDAPHHHQQPGTDGVLPGFTVAAVSEVVEEVVADGIVVQTLKSGTADDPSVIRLYRMAPGAVAGEDRHYAWEYLFILEGTFHDGSASWPAGTVISGAPGSVHYPSSVEGAKFLAVHPNGLGEPAA